MKKAIIFSLFILATPSFCHAACSGSSPTLTAASANYADVKDCTDIATYGDTVNIPACAQDVCVWSSGITITKDIKIVGAGKDSTYITSGFTADGTEKFIFKFIPDATARTNLDSLEDTNTFEISGINFYSSAYMSYKYWIEIENYSTPLIRRLKIHDNSFTKNYMAISTHGLIAGVFYSNTISGCRVWKGGGRDDVDDWTDNPMYPGDGSGFYIEDNVISVDTNVGALTSGANSGGGQVFRYNTASGTMSGGTLNDTHSIAGGQRKGSQMTEIYGNDFPIAGCGSGIAMRGGKVRVFYNKVRSDNALQVWQEYRDGYSTPPTTVYPDSTAWAPMEQNYDCTASETPYSCCTGEHTGTCATAQVCSSTANNCYKINHSYFWNNRRSDTNALKAVTKGYDHWNRDLSIVSDPLELVQNREWWEQGASFDGTTGVGCGTLAARPETCTTGVGYWATDQSCSDLTGLVGANATEIVGTLYKCTATDTWSTDGDGITYTPYEYPHPLRTNEAAPSLTVTVTNTGSGHSPSHDGARTVQTGGSLTFSSGVYNGWKVAIAGTCGCTTDGCTVTPSENCTITCTSSEIQLMPW